ncbi:hypothetical protein ACH47Z_40040 [Streptomyces sp. NPDC020192]|uniref:hypothetical protein n=1 Tax=Streptomyces sp. NPDC020192 TaxID=3365066 RepID=UPI00379F7E9F
MPRISCHFPITVSIVGEPSAAGLEQLGRAVEEALAERFRQARQHLATVTAREPAVPVETGGEPRDPLRIGPSGRFYRVPSFDGGGALKPVRLAAAAPPSRDPALLSDAQLDTEYLQVRSWLLGHGAQDAAYAGMRTYADALEEELRHRSAAATGAGASPPGPPPGPSLPGPPPPGPPLVLRPEVLAHDVPGPPTDRPRPRAGPYVGGAYGEQDLPHLLGERGVHAVITSTGAGAHRLNEPGIDYVGIHAGTRDIWLVDNKAYNTLEEIDGADVTSLGKNLHPSLTRAIGKIEQAPAFEGKADVLKRLGRARDAVAVGRPIPEELKIRLIVTNAGGYAPGAKNLPPQVEFLDLVGPEARAARMADIAKAKAAGVSPTRPRSLRDTETMRRRVGGVLSREPIRVPVTVRLARGVRAAGIGLAKVVAAVIWAQVAARVREEYESRKIRQWTEPKLASMEPEIQSRLDSQAPELVQLQLRNPGRPLYGVVGILTTVYWRGRDENLMDAEVELTSVSVAAERIEHSETSRVIGGSRWFTGEWQHDLVRTTHSVELQPFDRDELAAVLRAELAEEEAGAGARSMTPEQARVSERRRNELTAQLAGLERQP